MNKLSPHLSRLSTCLLAGFLLVLAARVQGETTLLLVVSSVLMFGCCWSSAAHLLGGRAANRFVLVAICLGWFAEQMGATRGWFFGSYVYTEVLGPRLGAVPVIIPMMWFALCYTGYVLGNLVVWQRPSDGRASLGQDVVMSLVGATIVSAYDLGGDPYMVYVLKAWIMKITDGAWFGETVWGLVGWEFVSFCILLAARRVMRQTLRHAMPQTLPNNAAHAIAPVAPRHALVPVALYAGLMLYQVCLGYPVETRTIAAFAMGFPLLTAACGLLRWKRDAAAPAGLDVAGAPTAVAMPLKEAA